LMQWQARLNCKTALLAEPKGQRSKLRKRQ
jgi:hypothetical protein